VTEAYASARIGRARVDRERRCSRSTRLRR